MPTDPNDPNMPVLMLRPPVTLTVDMFDQTFKRSMESMGVTEIGGMPLVLQGELERAGPKRPSPEVLLKMAREAGLDTNPPVPRCMAHRRQPEPDARQQLYFTMWSSQPFEKFRAQLRERLGETFDPDAITPVLFVGLVESSLPRWLPVRASEKDCVAPIQISSGEISSGAP
jgi:hypothetical protein